MTASQRTRREIVSILLALAFSTLSPARTASAQSTTSITITSVDTSAFPEVHALAAVSDAQGNRLVNLTKTSFQLLENNTPVAISDVSEEEAGVQLAFVIESSNVFAKRDPSRLTRLDYVKAALINFAVGDPEPYMKDAADDVSVIAPEGPILTHSTVGGEIRNALIAYESEFLFETKLFDLIGQAMDTVTAAPLRPGMRRIVVIFSSGIDPTADAEVSVLAARANAEKITFHTVIVGGPDAADSPPAENLKGLAALTGGSFRYFENADAMNPLWETVVSQRTLYRLGYRSKIAQSGQQILQAIANLPTGNTITSAPVSFSIAIQPPAVTLIDPPTDIVRAANEPGADTTAITPRSHDLTVQISFPDGYARSITKIQLLVDGALAGEKTAAPFGTIPWNLSSYAQTGIHSLQVIAVDELGLEGKSDVVNVLVTVQVPPPLTILAGPAVITLVVLGVVSIALAALTLAVIVFLRRPAILTTIVREAGQRIRESTEPFIPLPGRTPAKTRHGKAYLEVIESGQGPRPPIELVGDNLRLGRDETLAQIVLVDRSVSRLHARITEETDGAYFLYDEGSTSGTWVNYDQVSVTGHHLKHGDLINLGRVQLRFMLHVAEPQPAPLTPPFATEGLKSYLEDHATEPFEPTFAPPKAKPEATDPGIAQVPAAPTVNTASGDSYQTEAFAPPFEQKPKPSAADKPDNKPR